MTAWLVKLASVAPAATLTTALPATRSLLTSAPAPVTATTPSPYPLTGISLTVTLPTGRVSGALHAPALTVAFVVPTVNPNSVPTATPVPATLQTRNVPVGGGGGVSLLVKVTLLRLAPLPAVTFTLALPGARAFESPRPPRDAHTPARGKPVPAPPGAPTLP